MNIRQKFKDGFTKKYLLSQDKKWVRILDSLAPVFCLICAVIALYMLQTQPKGKLPTVSNIVVFSYMIASLPLAYLLYRPSDLKKIERTILVLFILSSSMSLLLSIMSVFINT
jgi:uncharacterized membrane protein YoaK (UPF0700 family)